MPTDHIVSLLIAERKKIDSAIQALRGTGKPPEAPNAAVPPSSPKKKRRISAATRRKMALGQKRRQEALKATKT